MECQGADLLHVLLCCSERAAHLARVCRQSTIFQDVVEGKADIIKNKTVMQDFKTVADVMVQAMVQHYISAEYPALGGHVLGEESCQFTTVNGTCLDLGVQPTEQETAELLEQAMRGADASTAARMASVVHGPPPDVGPVAAEACRRLEGTSLPLEDLAVWIDPIDCTSEYVRGAPAYTDDVTRLVTSGLPAVTVLVGVFRRSSGRPVMGVVTQPFGNQNSDGTWSSAQYWGVCHGDLRLSNLPPSSPAAAPSSVVMTSRSERDDVISSLRSAGLQPMAASGAGYKLLQVALGSALGFVVSLSSTFLWDTCAPDALLQAVGGSLVFKDGKTIRYDRTVADSRNSGCLLAARDEQSLKRLTDALATCPDVL
ncbi:Inositol polyphosphate 1-phosphatase [Amphibalanus amphitrite]|uniref:Inositol polyphosphate 1-phosphatase n=1 Tax=Amphibalanus amphitrite TaxID=1232801 RepID=A0A6A4VR94_AMPAM|nr:Inositol polyphosphate 1-phosphatase [Amphibalanus amphitrite]